MIQWQVPGGVQVSAAEQADAATTALSCRSQRAGDPRIWSELQSPASWLLLEAACASVINQCSVRLRRIKPRVLSAGQQLLKDVMVHGKQLAVVLVELLTLHRKITDLLPVLLQ